MSTDYVDRSNARGRQMERIEKMQPEAKKRWCKNHPLSKWDGGYRQCATGWRTNEPCEEGGQL